MENKKIVMCGCHEVGYNSIKSILEKGVKIHYFVLISKEKANQQKVSGYVSFEDLAKKNNIPIYYVETYSMKSDNDIAFFKKHKFDLLIQGGWQRLFPEKVLKTLSIGAIGVHGSSEFLPKGRGRSPINWSLIEGKKRFILHFFLMKSGVDDGDVFHFEMFDINLWDNCKTLYYKNSILTTKVLSEFIPRILSSNLKKIPQIGAPTYYKKRTDEDGLINWEETVFDIYNLTRAITRPYPGAFSYLENEKVFFWNTQPFDSRITYPLAIQGEVVEVFNSKDFVVNCNSGLLLITDYSSNSLIKVGSKFNNKTKIDD
jgi:methionyl-tRNA formyltransferase